MNTTAAYKGIRRVMHTWNDQKLECVDPMYRVVKEMFWRGSGYCPDLAFKLGMSDLEEHALIWQRSA